MLNGQIEVGVEASRDVDVGFVGGISYCLHETGILAELRSTEAVSASPNRAQTSRRSHMLLLLAQMEVVV